MIKHLLTTLCALALVTTGSIPALAAEADTGESARYYPISVLPLRRSLRYPQVGLCAEWAAVLPAGYNPEG